MGPMSTGSEVRQTCRSNAYRGPTGLFAAGFVQANLVAVPQEYSAEFLKFCRLNQAACPLLEVTTPGDTGLTRLADGVDLRTDLPEYRVWRDGVSSLRREVKTEWRDNLVSFLIGCSFSFDWALDAAGIEVEHRVRGARSAVYRTNQRCHAVGRFRGPLLVSTRVVRAADVASVVELTRHYPLAHGAPVHAGAPEQLGIGDLRSPFEGDAPEVSRGSVPLFWACGVTTHAVLEESRIPFAITHRAGCMLVSDVLIADIRDRAEL